MTELIIQEILDEVEQIVEVTKDCKECEAERRNLQRMDCEVCGEGVEDDQDIFALIGMDAVALFPSLSGENTARIVRRRVEKSKIIWRGFNWKKATIYIMANENLVEGIDKEVKKFFPIRKSNKGVKLGMASKGMSNKEMSEDKQWYWYRKDPEERIVKKMIGMISQIAIRVLLQFRRQDILAE